MNVYLGYHISGLRVETRIDYIRGTFWTDMIQGVNLDKFDCCPELRVFYSYTQSACLMFIFA